MKLRLPRILADEEDEDQVAAEPRPQDRSEPAPAKLHWAWTPAVAAAAAIPRLLYVFVFTNPENPGDGVYDDVWHHWQIAYLTKQVGLTAPGGPRLWDLKGMEYIWGPLHPLLMSLVFAVTGSVDIVLNRLVSLVFGVVIAVVMFHLARRYWGLQVGIASALFAALLPTSVMNDASGMVEPIAIALTLLGIWAWERRQGFWSGVGFALAAAGRAEEWIFSLGLVVAALLRRTRSQQRIPLVAGFAIVMVVYVKVLLDRTGDPIYPVWWNFIGHAAGQWGTPYITPAQYAMRPLFAALLLLSFLGLGWTLWKRPVPYMLLTFGFGYWVFVSGSYGFTAFLSDWQWWAPLTRRFEFPWLFLAVLLAALLLWWAPRRLGERVRPAGWVAVAGVLVASQLLWVPMHRLFAPTEAKWQATMADSSTLGRWYGLPEYKGHALALPPDRPDITYGLARYGAVDGKHLISEMYDPFAYPDEKQAIDVRIQCWLSGNDIRLMAVAESDTNLMAVVKSHPDWFVDMGNLPEAGWTVVGVTAPPCPRPAS